MKCTAIIVAAGSSRRMGFDKLAAPLKGKPLLAQTLSIFLDCPEIAEVILVGPPERMSLLNEKTFSKPVIRVDGGAERHLSVAAGLAAVSGNSEQIAIHDAARPLTSQADILKVIRAAKTHRAASLARRVTETLNRTNAEGFTESPISRENLWFIETPQVFSASLIKQAYTHVIAQDLVVTDETSALQTIGEPTKLIPSTSPNPKITLPADLEAIR